jgi:hypothetical protein
MNKEELRMKKGLTLFYCVSLFFFLPSFFVPLHAQESVAPLTEWMATVDSATQQIMLRWQPSDETATMGYHICTGNPCLDCDTVFGRLNTSYICVDHDPLEQHSYRLHVFDSSYNPSPLTPSFGNVVLEAEVPDCETTVRCHWSHYTGFPRPLGYEQPFYQLEILREPLDTVFTDIIGRNEGEPLEYIFDLPESVTRVWLRVVMGISNDFTNPEGTALRGIEAMEMFYRSIGMPVNIHGLIGREITDDEIREMVRKCSRDYTATTGSFKVLDAADMEAIYRLPR